MNSRQHDSEERLAEFAIAAAERLSGASVLVGGLGMGFTVRAALDRYVLTTEMAGPQGETGKVYRLVAGE